MRADPQILAILANEAKKASGEPLRLKARNFKPRLIEGKRFELSTFCIDGLDETQCWGLLDQHSPAVFGRAELTPRAFSDEGLTVDPDWDPERHVNIIDWPTEEHERDSIAQVLFARQHYVRRPV